MLGRRVVRRLRGLVNRTGDERGTTLVELATAMAVSLGLVLMAGTMVTVFSKAEASTVNSADAAAFTRDTLLQFQHDVQSAVPLDALPSSTCPACYTTYDDELQVTVQPSGQVVTWLYTPSTQKLTRQVGSGTPVVELSNVKNGDATTTGIPVFHFFDPCGNDLVAQALITSPAPAASSIPLDATVVQITLAVANLNSAPYGTTTSVNVMNKSPGISPSC